MVYCPSWQDRALTTYLCDCGQTMGRIISAPGRYTYFSEKTPRVITNLGHEPVEIRSHWEHEKVQKERGLAWAPQRRGMPGCWA